MQCPACAAAVPEDDRFCENCGVPLHAAPRDAVSCACGASAEEVDEDGFCLRCGHRVRRPPSDHVEQAVSPFFAGISDRGLRHDRNEDRFGLFAGDHGYALVVCDGVSSSQTSEVASLAVAEGVLASLSEALRGGPIAEPEVAMLRAIAAGEAVLLSRTAPAGGGNPPSTTVVAALVQDDHATVGWVGDSRAYWIEDASDEAGDQTSAQPLTRDHSWLNEAVSTRQMTVEQAAAAPQAHAITRWIGADAGDASTPEIAQISCRGPGTLLLCTDGLWNYAPTPEAMVALLSEASAADPTALATASSLVRFANDRGGQDNITALVLRLG